MSEKEAAPVMTIEDYEKVLASTRREAAKYRTQRKELREQLEDAQKAATRSLLQRDVLVHALNEQVEPKLVWALFATDGTLDGLDPESEDYTDKLSTAVKVAKADNPSLSTRLRGVGDGDQGVRTEPVTSITRRDLEGMPPDEIVALRKSGALDHLLGRS